MKTKTKLQAFGILLAARVWLVPTVLAQSTYEPYTFTTLAGNASYRSVDGTERGARFWNPKGVAVDSAGTVYVADSGNDAIRKVTPAGAVATLAGLPGSGGSADGTGSAARFELPSGVAVDSAGNIYVADGGNNTIRKVTPKGVVTTLAGDASIIDQSGRPVSGSEDGTGSAACFNFPIGVAVDSAGNVYVADTANNTIRKATPAGVVTTLAGLAQFDANGNPVGGSANGTGSAAQFGAPFGVAVDNLGNLYVTEEGNNTIRKGFSASSIPAPMLMPPSLSAGQFGFGITGLSGLAVEIESSRDLSQWQVIGTYVLEGGTNFAVSPTPAQGTQFYRGHAR